MVLITITRNDTNDIDNTYSLFTFATCVFFIFCIILSQTTTIKTDPASTTTSRNRSGYNGRDCDKCRLIDIFIFNQILSNCSSESDIASDSESAQQCGGFGDTQSGLQLATIISDNIECPSPLGDSEIATEQDKCDNNECGLIAVFFLDEFLLNGMTSGDTAAQRHDIVSTTQSAAQLDAIVAVEDTMTAKHAKCNGGNLKTLLKRLLDNNDNNDNHNNNNNDDGNDHNHKGKTLESMTQNKDDDRSVKTTKH